MRGSKQPPLDVEAGPICGHCLTGHHQACYLGTSGCVCSDLGHDETNAALRERQHRYVYPEPELHVPLRRRRVS